LISNAPAQEFRRTCQETLGFLSGHGFSDARLSGDPPIHSITVRFYGKTLAIECIWDDREEALEVKVARLRDGKPPSEFAVDASGQRVRDHLTSILLRRGVRGFGFRKLPPGTVLADRWRSHFEDYARLLQKHGEAVLREDPDVLA
jgi:hypothetical protein